MNPLTEKLTGAGLSEAAASLKDRLGLLNQANAADHKVVRVTAEIEPKISPLAWLKSSAFGSKIYWSERTGNMEIAAAGECLLFEADSYDNIESTITGAVEILNQSSDDIRIFGGIRFPSAGSNGHSADWQEFKSCRMVIPRFELVRQDNQCYLAFNIKSSELSNILKLSNEIDAILTAVENETSEHAAIVNRRDEPNFDGWTENIKSIFEDFALGKIEKIVLARQSSFQFKENCRTLDLLKRLIYSTPHCYHYYFQPRPGLAFLGASPEQLYARRGRQLSSEALAGTRPRGNSPGEDLTLGDELLHDEKELREHNYVVENIKSALGAVCEYHSENNATRLLKLNRVQHLQTKFNGTLKKQVSDSDIIKSLHPTSAVGGFPSIMAQTRIAQCEKFDRGWYAGAVGWLAKDAAEFAVAIRSGLVRGNELKLFSGAGIVAGSTPEAEWAEIESKIGSFLSAVTG